MSTNNDGELCLISLNRAELRDAVRQVIDDDDLGQSWTEAELTDHIESVLDQYDLSGGQEIDVDQLRADLHDDLHTDLLAELQETQITPSDVEDIVYRVLDDVTDGGFGEGGYGDGGFGGDPDRLNDIEARLDALEAREPTDPDLSDYVSRGEVDDLIDERLREMDLSGGGGATDEDIANVLREFGVDATLSEIRSTRRAVEFPGRRVGPQEPRGDLHTPDMWGIEMVITDRLTPSPIGTESGTREGVVHIADAAVDAGETGTFTAQLGEYDGVDFDIVDEQEVTIRETGVQRVDLDLVVPEGGRYLLTRPETFQLRRGPFADWDEHMSNGLKLVGGAKPDSYGGSGINTSDNDNWYYFFDLAIAAGPDHHLED